MGLSMGSVGSNWGVVRGFKSGIYGSCLGRILWSEPGICGFRLGSRPWV